MQSSTSVAERNKGNEFYQSAGVTGIGNTVKRGRLQDAILCYNQAVSLANNEEDLASAAKNLGKATWRFAQLLCEGINDGTTMVIFYMKKAIKAFDTALVKGEDCKSANWKDDIKTSLTLSLEELFDITDELDGVDERVQTLNPLMRSLRENYHLVLLHLKIGNLLFHDGVTKLHDSDYVKCLSLMKDCYYPIEEAKRLSAKSKYEESEINVLEKDVYYTTCTAESIQARECGTRLLDVALKEEELFDVGLAWDVVDWYTRAAILARELDLEQEAIALSRLGHVYNNVFKLRERSKVYYKKSLELAESMKPRTFFLKDWYKDVVSTLQKFQMEDRMWDENEKQKEREKKLEEIKEEMADLKKNNTGKIAFLVYVYKTFPPKNPKWKKPSDEDIKKWKEMENDFDKAKEVRKILLNGLTAYHPDKVDAEEHGEKWKTLCEEITKMISARYETMKVGGDN